jgi:hypothetical protein
VLLREEEIACLPARLYKGRATARRARSFIPASKPMQLVRGTEDFPHDLRAKNQAYAPARHNHLPFPPGLWCAAIELVR